MTTINTHIANIQNLAEELTEAQNDHQRLEVIACKIESTVRKLMYEIEDAHSRIAKHFFDDLQRDTVRLPVLAKSMFKDESYQKEIAWEMRGMIQAGTIPAVKRDERYYATLETLTEYFRERSRRDTARRASIAGQASQMAA